MGVREIAEWGLPRSAISAGHSSCCDGRRKENSMAHPDPNRAGSERGQREHSGPTSEASDAGMKDKSQSQAGTKKAERKARENDLNAPREDEGDEGAATER
jgi:hypothetical protein